MKKNKPKIGKKPSRNKVDTSVQKGWDSKKPVTENFKQMGLVMNVKPSMRQTLQGKALLSEARVTLNQKYYKNRGKFDEELSLAQTDKIKFEDTKKEV